MRPRFWLIDMPDGSHKAVSCLEDIDRVMIDMLSVPESERGEKWQEAIDAVLDARMEASH